MKSKKKRKHSNNRQTDIQTDTNNMYNNMAGAACVVPLQEHFYMRTICY